MTSTHDQVDRTGRRVVADLEAAENQARREQNLTETVMRPVWPELVVDFEFGPKIFEQMILEGGVPKYRITEIPHIHLR